MDVIWTEADQGALNPYGMDRINVELQAAIAALSMGPVGIGDAPGHTNASRIAWISAFDGENTLKHPSRPMTPVDAMFWPGSSMRPANDGQIWQSNSIIPGVDANSPGSGVDASMPFQSYDRVFAGNQSGPPLSQSDASSPASHFIQLLVVDIEMYYKLPFAAAWPVPPGASSGKFAAVPYVFQGMHDSCKDGQAASECLAAAWGPPSGQFGSGSLIVHTGEPSGNNHTFDVLSGSPVVSGADGWSFALLGEVDAFARVSGNRFAAIDTTSLSTKGLCADLRGGVGEQVQVAFVISPASSQERNPRQASGSIPGKVRIQTITIPASKQINVCSGRV